uniref:Retrovirus-related Pol polyprotein from transposon TNT 1-94 n=1 Tax=Tanacetum cinerariifolium TaxID=118510 RepID=A0A699J3L5_TANCI|nr:hypothetical protein [Tanacetum cinerariifolium]
MLIFSKASMFLWAEAVATACYTKNRSPIYTRHNKTLYELVHDNKPDLTFFRVFGALCYPTNDNEDLGKLQPTTAIRIFVGYAPSRKLSELMAPVRLSTGPAPTFMTPGHISLELVPNPIPAAPYVTPTNKDLEILFQPMFDKYLEPPRIERPVSPTPAIPFLVNSAAGSTIIEDNPFAPIDNDPFINIFALKPSSEASSSRDAPRAWYDTLSRFLLDNKFSKGPAPTFLMPGQISSWLVPNLVLAAPYVPPTNKDLEILFQPMFDEYLESPRVDNSVSPASAVPVPVNTTNTPSSTTIDQDAPSPSHSPSSLALQSPSLQQSIVAESTITKDNLLNPVDHDPFVNVFALEPSSEASSSGDVSSTTSTYVTQTHYHLGK